VYVQRVCIPTTYVLLLSFRDKPPRKAAAACTSETFASGCGGGGAVFNSTALTPSRVDGRSNETDPVFFASGRFCVAMTPQSNTIKQPDERIGEAWLRSVSRIDPMEGSTEVRSWLRCYRCWSQNLEVQLHYEGIHRIDPETGERTDVVDEMQEAVVQCLECMHDQPHLGFHNGRVEPIEDRWERMITGTPWIASCTVTVDADDVETCSGPDAGDSLSYAAFGDHGTREFFTHVRFHKHDDDRIVVHLLVELYARTPEEATEVLEEAARGTLAITSLAEESRPPASTGRSAH
jgi:hypothetical protein